MEAGALFVAGRDAERRDDHSHERPYARLIARTGAAEVMRGHERCYAGNRPRTTASALSEPQRAPDIRPRDAMGGG